MKSTSLGTSLMRALATIDLYGQQFYLPVNNHKKFSTKLGIILTILIFGSMVGYSAYKLKVFFGMSSYQVISASLATEVNYTNPEVVDFASLGFDFAFAAYGDIPETMGRLELVITEQEQVLNETTGYAEMKLNSQIVPLSKCGDDGFNYEDQSEIEQKGISSYYCLTNKSDLRIGGTYQALLYRYITINLYLCENSTEQSFNCATYEEQSAFFTSNAVQLRFTNQYFDASDNEQVIKKYIDDKIYFPIILGQKSLGSIGLMKSTARIKGRYPWDSDEVTEFAQVKNIVTHSAMVGFGFDQAIISINFDFDYFTDVYEKQQYTLMDMLSELGGLFNSVLFIGKVSSIIFITNSYLAYITSNLYFIEHKKQISEEELVQKAVQKISNSDRIQVGIWPQIKYFVCCLSLKKPNYQNSITKHPEGALQRAKEKFYEEFDLIKVFKSLQELRALKNHLISKSEQVLLRHQLEFYLDSDSQSPLSSQLNEFNFQDPVKKFYAMSKLSSQLLLEMDAGKCSELGLRILKGVVRLEEANKSDSSSKKRVRINENQHFLQTRQLEGMKIYIFQRGKL